jgi:hypothetical protein
MLPYATTKSQLRQSRYGQFVDCVEATYMGKSNTPCQCTEPCSEESWVDFFRTGSRALLEYIIRGGVLECIQYPFSYSPDRSLCLYHVTSSSGWLPTVHVNECHFGWRDPSNLMPGSEDKCSHPSLVRQSTTKR